MRFEISDIGVLEVKTNYDDGCPAFHIHYNGETIAHIEMHLDKRDIELFVWPKECFESEHSMNNFVIYKYPAQMKGVE